MLHLIPPPLHRSLYRLAYRARLIWWRIRRPRHSSVLVIALDDRGRILLVRHSYGPRVWSLPGGGVDRGEDPAHAAEREIGEELGCGLRDLAPVGARDARTAGSRETRHVFTARLAGSPEPDMREIVAVLFAEPGNLPADCGPRSRRLIEWALAHRREPARSQQR